MATCGTGTGNFPQPGDPDLNNSILSATAAYGGIDLNWTYPNLNPHAVQHTILYRSQSSDPTTKVKHHIVAGDFFFDTLEIEAEITYYYWIQIVSVNGTVGDLIGPAGATARPSIEDTLERLTGRIKSGELHSSLTTELNKIVQLRSDLDTETANRVNGDDSITLSFGNLEAQVDNLDTLIVQETTNRQDGDTAIISDVNLLFSRVDDADAAIANEQTVRADADSALASDISTVQTSLGNDIATVQTNLNTEIERVDGEITNIGARYTAQVDVNGLVGGFGIYNDGTTVEAGFLVNKFWIGDGVSSVYPFMVNGGNVYIKSAVIEDASIGTAKIAEAAIKTLQVDDAAITDAKIDTLSVDKLVGTVIEGKTLRTAGSGERFEVDSIDNRAKFYDANNNLIAELGNIDGFYTARFESNQNFRSPLSLENNNDDYSTGAILRLEQNHLGSTTTKEVTYLKIKESGGLMLSASPSATIDFLVAMDGISESGTTVGSLVFARTEGGEGTVYYGDTISGSMLTASGYGNTGSATTLPGTWKCLGKANFNRDQTLYIKISN